jgi:hypothetical protein
MVSTAFLLSEIHGNHCPATSPRFSYRLYDLAELLIQIVPSVYSDLLLLQVDILEGMVLSKFDWITGLLIKLACVNHQAARLKLDLPGTSQ